MDSTEKFRQALPYAVLQASPGLAALLSSNNHPPCADWCFKCGSYLLNGSAEIQITRPKKQKRATPSARVLRKTCRACGWQNDLSVDSKQPPSIRDPRTLTPPATVASPLISPTSVPPSRPPPPTQTKSRPKKKPGLQEILLRNRQKKDEQQSNKNDGLAAFLSGLK